MPERALLGLALLCSLGGMACLALAMDVHWEQVRQHAGGPGRRIAVMLRSVGGAALLASLLLCLRADHPSMAVLVWIMSIAAAAVVVALALAWRPRWLSWLVAWRRAD